MTHSLRFRCACIGAGLLLLIGGVILGALAFMAHQSHVLPSPQTTGYGNDYHADEQGFPRVDWEYWLAINPDIVGWITIPHSRINHPIVQASSDNPEYYLHHDIYRHYNLYGTPYLDAACAKYGLLSAPNAVICGHHMNDGSQFSDLASCSNESYARAHATILLQTPQGIQQTYHIRCVRIVPGSSIKRTSFASRDDYLKWYKTQIDTSCVVLDGATKPVGVMKLVTCSYHYSSNERTLVIASKQD